MVAREGAKPADEVRESALDALKKPLPPPKVSDDPKSVAVKSTDLADITPPAPVKPA